MTLKQLIAELTKIAELNVNNPEMPVVLENTAYGSHNGYDPVTQVNVLTIEVATETHHVEGKFVEVESWRAQIAEKSERAVTIINF